MLEYEKYQELQAKSQRMQEDYERQLQDAEEGKEQALEELTEHYDTKLQERSTQLEHVSDFLCMFSLFILKPSSLLIYHGYCRKYVTLLEISGVFGKN